VIGANAVRGSNGKFFLQKLVGDQRRVDGEQQRIAVGLGIGDRGGTRRPPGAGAIVDDDVAAEALGQRLAQDAGHGVGRAARREIDDERDGTAGIFLRRGKRHGRHRRRATESQDEVAPSHQLMHLGLRG
jgi:hypothetical protein